MAGTTDEDAVLGLSAAALARVDGRQLELLEVLGPELLTARTGSPDGALGFGEADVAWVAAVVPVASVALDVLLDAAKGAASDAVKDGVLATVRRLRARRRDGGAAAPAPAPGPDAAVPDAVIERVRDEAVRHARAVGLDDERARTLAAAVVGSLRHPPPVG